MVVNEIFNLVRGWFAHTAVFPTTIAAESVLVPV